MTTPGLAAHNLFKSYQRGPETLEVLRSVSLTMKPGESMAITGPSGSGKSTLLHLLGALDTPDRGTIEVDGVNLAGLDAVGLARFRNQKVGFVFQHHHLLPQYNILENTLLPTLAFSDTARDESWARELLDRVGLTDRLTHRPSELSGGERQRVALARALVLKPSLLLCDEPTGSLDPSTAGRVADLLLELHQTQRSILVTVTHSEELATRFPRRTSLVNGQCAAH